MSAHSVYNCTPWYKMFHVVNPWPPWYKCCTNLNFFRSNLENLYHPLCTTTSTSLNFFTSNLENLYHPLCTTPCTSLNFLYHPLYQPIFFRSNLENLYHPCCTSIVPGGVTIVSTVCPHILFVVSTAGYDPSNHHIETYMICTHRHVFYLALHKHIYSTQF